LVDRVFRVVQFLTQRLAGNDIVHFMTGYRCNVVLSFLPYNMATATAVGRMTSLLYPCLDQYITSQRWAQWVKMRNY